MIFSASKANSKDSEEETGVRPKEKATLMRWRERLGDVDQVIGVLGGRSSVAEGGSSAAEIEPIDSWTSDIDGSDRVSVNGSRDEDFRQEEFFLNDKDQAVQSVSVQPVSSFDSFTKPLVDDGLTDNLATSKSAGPVPLKVLGPQMHSGKGSGQARTLPCDLSLSVEEDLKQRFGSNIRSALGPSTVIEGKFSFDSPVRVDGSLSGTVSSSSALIVGEQAEVDAEIKVGTLIVLGRVIGDVEASDLVEIRRGGSIDGKLVTGRLLIEEGGYYEGAVKMK